MSPRAHDEPRADQLVGELTFRICLADMDPVNIYYAAYYEWMDRSFAEFLRQAGHSVAEVFDGGFALPIVHSSCSYVTPVKLDELLRVRSWISRIGRTSFTLTHDFARSSDGQRVAQGTVTHVWVRIPGMQRTSLPDWFRNLGPIP